jgi:hypothetical protein
MFHDIEGRPLVDYSYFDYKNVTELNYKDFIKEASDKAISVILLRKSDPMYLELGAECLRILSWYKIDKESS